MVGYGWFAELLQDRVVATVDGLAVVAAVDPSPERRAKAEEHGLLVAETLEELLQDGSSAIDAVAVLTPHDTHLEIVRAAADHGLHVFCEKAFAVSSADCVSMVEACWSAGVVLVVGHMQKLFETHARAVEIAHSGDLGTVRSVNVDGTHWCPVFPGWWRSTDRCGGLLYWTGIHDLDTMRALVGSEASRVFAVTAQPWDDYTQYEDVVAATIVYDNGAIGTIHVAEQWPLRTFEESFEVNVVLTSGGIRIVPAQARVDYAARSGQDRGQVESEFFESFERMEENAYRRELGSFVEAVRGGDLEHQSVLDGLRCVETLEAIYRSVRSGRPESVTRHAVEYFD
jgi:predicted dehydrogenase